MATNLSSCFSTEFLEQLLKFLVNFTLLKYVKSYRSYGFLITKELIFGFQILDLKDHFSASLSRLLRSSNSKHKAKQHFCMNCSGFSEEKTRDGHYVYWSKNETVRVEMSEDPILKFNDGQGQLKAPFMIYADFESILEPMDTASDLHVQPSFIPVVFHNLSGYDAHMFIRELAKYSINDMNVIAKSNENYISFSAHVLCWSMEMAKLK